MYANKINYRRVGPILKFAFSAMCQKKKDTDHNFIRSTSSDQIAHCSHIQHIKLILI